MVMVQDGPYTNAPEKPLRIMGDQQRCQRGKDLVQDLLTEKELEVVIYFFCIMYLRSIFWQCVIKLYRFMCFSSLAWVSE